jgi:hypothetical protein
LVTPLLHFEEQECDGKKWEKREKQKSNPIS